MLELIKTESPEKDVLLAIAELTRFSTPKEYREKILKIDEAILAIPGTYTGNQDNCPLKHSFGYNLYRRELFMPKGMLITSRIHKYNHFYEVIKGKCTVFTEQGLNLIEAPYSGTTKAGTKRLLYIIEDTIWITYHGCDKVTPEEAEDYIFAKSFDEIPLLED